MCLFLNEFSWELLMILYVDPSVCPCVSWFVFFHVCPCPPWVPVFVTLPMGDFVNVHVFL